LGFVRHQVFARHSRHKNARLEIRIRPTGINRPLLALGIMGQTCSPRRIFSIGCAFFGNWSSKVANEQAIEHKRYRPMPSLIPRTPVDSRLWNTRTCRWCGNRIARPSA